MAVIMIAEVQGQTPQGYDGMLAALGETMRASDGFLLHGAHPTGTGWRVIEVWASKAQCNAFYARQVAPQLPPGIRPKRSVTELHSVLTPR